MPKKSLFELTYRLTVIREKYSFREFIYILFIFNPAQDTEMKQLNNKSQTHHGQGFYSKKQ